MVHMWRHAKGRCANKGGWDKTNNVKIFKCIQLIILITVYASKNENVLQLWSKDDWLQQSHIPPKFTEVLSFEYASVSSTSSNSKLELIRDVFEII